MADTASTTLPKETIAKPASSAPLSPLKIGVRRIPQASHGDVWTGTPYLIMIYISFGSFASRGYCTPIKQNVSGEVWANCNDTHLKLKPPSSTHIFGTDVIGREYLCSYHLWWPDLHSDWDFRRAR